MYATSKAYIINVSLGKTKFENGDVFKNFYSKTFYPTKSSQNRVAGARALREKTSRETKGRPKSRARDNGYVL